MGAARAPQGAGPVRSPRTSEQGGDAEARAVAYLCRILGQQLVAIIADAPDPDDVDQWARGEVVPTAEIRRRLRSAYRITKLLEPHEAPDTVRAWFVGMNVTLGDRAPALAVADDPAAVLRAARAFVAYG